MSLEVNAGDGNISWSLEDTVIQFENVSSVPAKQRHTNVAELAKAIVSHAYDHGLTTAILGRLVDIITRSKHCDQATLTSLIKNLYPAEKVPSSIVTKVVCCLGPSKNKPSPATQALLLRWLILVYDYLEDQSHLSKLYASIFDHLDMVSLRRSLCHLLSMITRRKHVKPFRIQALMELLRNVGDDEREVLGLLRVFKSYYPDIIVGESSVTRRRATYFFKHPDPEWAVQLEIIQERLTRSSDQVLQTFQVVRRMGVKRSRVEVVIPEVQTSRISRTFTSLEEIGNVSDFVQKVDRIELPSQIASALLDPLAQKYLSLMQNENASNRLESWLDSFFEDELDRLHVNDEGDGPGNLAYLLEALVSFIRFTKKMPLAVDRFLCSYLTIWNGQDNRDAILGLMEYIPVQGYEELCQKYFIPFESAILGYGVESKNLLLRCYSSLIRHWGATIRTSAFKSPPLSQVIERAELLSLTIIESTPNPQTDEATAGISSTLSVLQFYTTLAHLFTFAPTHASVRLTIPFRQTVYIIAFTPTISHISILCSVLATYKSSFEASLTSTTLRDPSSPDRLYPTATVAQFNGYVMDLCNLLWRNRGLNADDPNALGCLVSASTASVLADYLQELNDEPAMSNNESGKYRYQLSSVFSLSHNAALCGIIAACFRSTEDQSEKEGRSQLVRLTRPVTQKALATLEKDGGIKMNWQEYRLKALNWLDEMGSEGIGNLMRSTMKALRKA